MPESNIESATTKDTHHVADLPPVNPTGPSDQTFIGDDRVAQTLKTAWLRDGFAVLRNAIDQSTIADYNAIVAQVRASVPDGKDEYGYGERIGQLHQKCPDLIKIPANPQVVDFLTWAFGDEAILFGSLNFERGTQQDAHVDAIFFWPEPSYSMAGVWVALEEVHPDAGPLFYVPQSHKWPFYMSDHVVEKRPELAAQRDLARQGLLSTEERGLLISQLGAAWTEDFKGLERQFATDRIKMSLNPGDVVIWHSLLAHGGSVRMNPTLSRRSAVFHYIGLNSKLYTFEQFMLYGKAELPAQPDVQKDLAEYGGLKYMRFPYFVTNVDGKETVHPLT